MKSEITELYKEAFETWRFQIESYWTRNTYFAAFEIAAIGGDWTVSAEHHWTAAFAAVMSILLTMIWFLNCCRQLEYIRFWWAKLIEFDSVMFQSWQEEMSLKPTELKGVRPVLLASDFGRWRTARKEYRPHVRYSYSMLVLWVPGIFCALWFYLVAYNLRLLQVLGWPLSGR